MDTILTLYRYSLIFTSQLLYILAAFMPVLQAIADTVTDYVVIIKRQTKRTSAFLAAWFNEAMQFRASVLRDCKVSVYLG